MKVRVSCDGEREVVITFNHAYVKHIEQLSKDRVLLNTLQTMHSRLVNLSSRGDVRMHVRLRMPV